ncbi:hypothetical protein AB1N83_011062 [Pleurotus pulmonarius]
MCHLFHLCRNFRSAMSNGPLWRWRSSWVLRDKERRRGVSLCRRVLLQRHGTRELRIGNTNISFTERWWEGYIQLVRGSGGTRRRSDVHVWSIFQSMIPVTRCDNATSMGMSTSMSMGGIRDKLLLQAHPTWRNHLPLLLTRVSKNT